MSSIADIIVLISRTKKQAPISCTNRKSQRKGETAMARILIIKHPNTAMAEIQTTDRLCEYQYSFSPPADDELTPEFIAFRDKLKALHGFQKIEIGRHEISMERYEVFSFEELIPQVINALKEFTGSEYEVTTDGRAERYARQPRMSDHDDFDMSDFGDAA